MSDVLAKQLRAEAAALSGRPDYRGTVDLLDLAADALGMVVWNECAGCGTAWPFPHPEGMGEREWKCQVCLEAEYARLRRETGEKLDAAMAESRVETLANIVKVKNSEIDALRGAKDAQRERADAAESARDAALARLEARINDYNNVVAALNVADARAEAAERYTETVAAQMKQLESDREYNAELVRERDAEIARLRTKTTDEEGA